MNRYDHLETGARAEHSTPRLKTSALFLRRAFASLIPLLLLCAFFLPSAKSGLRYAYRDVASYYYPLFEQIQKSWESGVPPLWNPYINLGQPLAGDPTASIFYPGKLLFLLSSANLLSFAFCFKLYLWLHVALAFYSASRLARTLGVSVVGATLSGISFAFSGQVLFQYTNVVYLVGSAWAPLHYVYAIAFFRGKTISKKIAAICKLSVVLAVTILGGEPQIVYLTLLSSTIIGGVFQRLSAESRPCKKHRVIRKITLATSFLIGTVALSSLLGAVQILPSFELAERSTRENEKDARSLWDLPKASESSLKNGQISCLQQKEFYKGLLCQDFSTGGRSESIYRFSVGPWRWLEFLFPNIGGKQYPQNSRWFEIFPEELALWTPSLYFGVVPFALALAAARIKRRSPVESARVAASWLSIFGLLGALGGYGVVWLFHVIESLASGSSISPVFRNGDPVGGLYWLLTLVAPKFAAFRFPAKLATVTAVGFSLLAGIGWDTEKYSRRFTYVCRTVLYLALIGEVVAIAVGKKIFNGVEIPPNPLFGPFQAELAAQSMFKAFAQTAIVLITFSLPLTFLKRTKTCKPNGAKRIIAIAGLLIVVAIDLYVANSWLVVTAPTKLFERHSNIVEELTVDDNTPPLRVYRSPIWFPPIFQTHSSPKRIEERILWEVETLYPLYSSAKGVAILDVRAAFMEKEFAQFIDAAATETNLGEELAFLDVYGVLGPQFWTKRVLPENDNQITNEPFDWRVDFKKVGVPATRASLVRNNTLVATSKNDSVDILKYSLNEVVFLVTASEASEVIVSEQYWPDWKVALIPVGKETLEAIQPHRQDAKLIDEILSSLRTSPNAALGTIEPAFGFLRKTRVPKGQTCVIMSYCPKLLYIGGTISLSTWLSLALITSACTIVHHVRRNRDKRVVKRENAA